MYNKSFFAEGQVFSVEDKKMVITRVDIVGRDVLFCGVSEDGRVFDSQPVDILDDCECLHEKSRPFLDAFIDLRKRMLDSEAKRREIVEMMGGSKLFCEEVNISLGTLYTWFRTGKVSAQTSVKIETLLNRAGLTL